MTRHSELAVQVDTRENNADDLARAFDEHADVASAEVVELDVGDVVVDGQVVFERKIPSDFRQSITDNRLEDQISRMYEEFGAESSYVTVLGSLDEVARSDDNYSELSESAVYGFVGSIMSRWQMVPFFVCYPDIEVEMVTRIARKHEEESDREIRSPESTPTRKSDDFYERMLVQLDGIGHSTAESIREEFANPHELIHAGVDELVAVDGVGEKTASDIVDQVRLGGD